eukprot:scpid106297/ scgid7635/ 
MAHQLAPLSLAFLAFAMLLLVSGHMVNGSSSVRESIDFDSVDTGMQDEVDEEEGQTGADNGEGAGAGIEEEGTGASCMVRRMLKAGTAQSKALHYEQRALLVPMSEDVISSADVGLLKFALQSTRADAQAIQKCILQQSEVCKTYSPCLNVGQCQLSLSNTSYVCK